MPSLLNLRKQPITTAQETEWALQSVRMPGEVENLSPLPEMKPQFFGHPAHSLPTELSQILTSQSAEYQIYLLCVPEKTGELTFFSQWVL